MKRIAAAMAVAALAGCVQLAPKYERPPAPVAAQFPQPVSAPAAGAAAAQANGAASPAAAADLDWQDFFADPRLKQLIALALRENRDLRIAALTLEQLQAQAAARDADRWPTLSAGLAAVRQPTGRGSITSLYTAGVQVSGYEADLFGRLRNLSEAAAAQVLAGAEARKAVQISLVAAIASTHLALVADDELIRVADEARGTREEALELIRLRVQHGASSQLELRQAESLLETAHVALAQARRQRLLDENALVQLVGQPLPAVPGSSMRLPELPELPVGLPSEVLLRRPDVRAAEQQLVAAHANIGAVRAAFFPRITLTGSLGSASNHLSGLFGAGSFAWSFAPQLLQPLFDAGRNEANLKAAQAAREIALAQYERAIQAAFREVADALAGRATLVGQLQAQQRLVQAEAARSAMVELRQRAGAASALEVLDAQRSLLAAQQALVQVRLAAAQNGAQLYKALGGGWSAQAAMR